MSGSKTHAQQQRIINKQEKTKGADTPVNETLKEAQRKHPRAPTAYDMRTGDRSIKRGSSQETAHRKERSGD
jgi:hypothetical protein